MIHHKVAAMNIIHIINFHKPQVHCVIPWEHGLFLHDVVVSIQTTPESTITICWCVWLCGRFLEPEGLHSFNEPTPWEAAIGELRTGHHDASRWNIGNLFSKNLVERTVEHCWRTRLAPKVFLIISFCQTSQVDV